MKAKKINDNELTLEDLRKAARLIKENKVHHSPKYLDCGCGNDWEKIYVCKKHQKMIIKFTRFQEGDSKQLSKNTRITTIEGVKVLEAEE